VVVGAAAIAAAVVGLALLTTSITVDGDRSSPSGSRSESATTLLSSTGCCRIPGEVRRAQASMVALLVATAHGVVRGCGVAVARGGLIATTLDAIVGGRSLTAITSSGTHEPARIVAADPVSDVALVKVESDLPAAPFVDDAAASTGRPAMVLGMTSGPRKGSTAVTMWADGTIRSVGAAVPDGDGSGMATIEAVAPSAPSMDGELLLDPHGRVMGILDRSGSPGAAAPAGSKTFLPSMFVVGVAHDLAGSNQVDHGWLDISGDDAPLHQAPDATGASVDADVRGGAEVVSVQPGGASRGILRPRDVIVSIDGQPVRTMAELRSRLYVLGAGSRVSVGVVRAGTTRSFAVTLSGTP
jgi:S1-C subfamily serine protease